MDDKRVVLGNLLILGDSYSTFKGYIPNGFGSYYGVEGGPETDVNRVEYTWWHRLLSQTESNLVVNCSWTGSTICNTGYDKMDFTDRSFISRFDKLVSDGFIQSRSIDTMLVFGGTNDTWAGSPIGELKWGNWEKKDLYEVAPACCYLLHRIRQVLPATRVCFIINSGLSEDVVSCILSACERYGVETLSLDEVDKVEGHPTISGMADITRQVLEHFEKSL